MSAKPDFDQTCRDEGKCGSFLTKSEKPCKRWSSKIAMHDRYCEILCHNPATLCGSTRTRNGFPCRNSAGADGFCGISNHNPHNRMSTDPTVFRKDYLRKEIANDSEFHILRCGKDAYSDILISTYRSKAVVFELDHVVELQVIRDAYDDMMFFSPKMSKKQTKCIEFLKNHVVNEYANLNFTTQAINAFKCDGTTQFLEDYKTKKVSDQGMFDYLHLAKLNRSVSKSIQKEIKSSFDFILGLGIADEYELLHQELHDRMVAMSLD